VSAIVLISSAEHLAALKEREDMSGAQAFADTQALQALEVIMRERPPVVALERLFASTSRGAAFINRIKVDPALSSSEIRIVSHDSTYAHVSARRSAEPVPDSAPVAIVEAPAPAPAPLDQRGTRRAPRFKITGEVEVLVDGNPATLIDVSLVGAQVISISTLRPNQRLRMSLPDANRSIRFSAGVAWAAFEMPKSGPRYRAGIEFYDADPDAMNKFIADKADKKAVKKKS
jgi:hypothetical protein